MESKNPLCTSKKVIARKETSYSYKREAVQQRLKENISSIIKEECDKNSQKVMSLELGVSRQTLTSYINGVNLPAPDIYYVLHNKFHISYEKMIEGNEGVSEVQKFYKRFQKLPDKDKKCIEYIMERFEQISQM